MNFIKQFKSLPNNTRKLMSLGIIVALVVALPLFIWAFVNLNFNQKEKAASGEPVDITLGEPIIGLPDATVTIVAYTDFQCPFCKSFVDNTFSTILATYPNDVRFIFKDFPILNIHPLAERAAIAGQCAFAQDKFWEMHDLIFAKQDTLSEVDLGSDFPVQLGLDMATYNTCYSNRETLPEVQDDMTEGVFKGVSGTPTFFINGTKLEGALPFSAFQAVIEQELGSDAVASPTSTSNASPTAVATPTDNAIGGYVEGEPNSCGGTCGSNYNCKANLYCYQGYCRSPLCSSDTDCNCSNATAAPTAKPTNKAGGVIKTATPKSSSSAKGSVKPMSTYVSGIVPLDDTNEMTRENEFEVAPENQFLNKYAVYVFGAFLVVVALSIYYAVKKNRNNNTPHIMPPTNI